jgi:hypothetical protein
MNKPEVAHPDDARKPYEKPTLNVWGDLRTVTAGGGGTSKDGQGNAPRTLI